MQIIIKYVEGLNTQNPDIIAALFAEDAYLCDAAQRPFGGGVAICRGREEIRTFFQGIFDRFQVTSKLVVSFGRRAYYDVLLDNRMIPCIGTVIEENGLIAELIVDPR